MGDGPSDRACGDDRRLTTTVEGLPSTWKPERGVEGGWGGQEEEPGVVGRGKKTRLASKRALPANSTGVYRCRSLRRIEKKDRSPQLWLFPNPSMHCFPVAFALDKQALEMLAGCFVGSKLHLAWKWNFQEIST